MKIYTSPNHATFMGIILLLISIIIGSLLIGVLAYYISQYFYIIVVYSVLISFVSMIAYNRLLQSQKVRNWLITTITGLLAGTLIWLGFYGTPYLQLRQVFISETINEYKATASEASEYLDYILLQETGYDGFVGYLFLRAREGDEFTQYPMFNGAAIGELHFELKGLLAWIYWIFDYAIVAIALMVTGYYVGKQPFNILANEWYGQYPNQIGVMQIENKEQMNNIVGAGKLLEFGKMIVPEGQFSHPLIEIYEQHSKNNKGDVLLTIKETTAIDGIVHKRKIINQYEISQEEYKTIKGNIYSENA